MLIPILRLVLSLTTSWDEDQTHEIAHRACEELVYEIVAPECGYDDCTTPLGEELAGILCRGEDSRVLTYPEDEDEDEDEDTK